VERRAVALNKYLQTGNFSEMKHQRLYAKLVQLTKDEDKNRKIKAILS
jgi:hypothetical protein